MAGDALHVEPVDEPVTAVTAREGPLASGSATIYWWQLALFAARAQARERELERERRRRERVIDRYEKLLADRQREIEALRSERDGEDGLSSVLPP